MAKIRVASMPAIDTRLFAALAILCAVCPCIVSASRAYAIATKTLSAAARTAGFFLHCESVGIFDKIQL